MGDGCGIDGLLQLSDLALQRGGLIGPGLQCLDTALVLRVLGRRHELRLLKLDLGGLGGLDTVVEGRGSAQAGYDCRGNDRNLDGIQTKHYAVTPFTAHITHSSSLVMARAFSRDPTKVSSR